MADQARADSREEMMKEMGKKHSERLGADTTPVETQEPPDNPDIEPDEPAEEAVTEPETPKGDATPKGEDAQASQGLEAEDDPDQAVIIDGAEERHKKSVIDAAGGLDSFSKLRAANKRMQEAALARKEAFELKKRYEELVAASEKEKKPDPAPAPLPAVELAKQMRAIERKIYLEATTQEEVDALLEQKESLQEKWYEAKQRDRQAMDEAVRQQQARTEHLKSVTAALHEKHPGWETLQEDPAFDRWIKAPENEGARAVWRGVPNIPSVLKVVADFKATQKPITGFDETREKKKEIDVVPSAGAKVPATPEKKPPTDSQYVQGLRKMRAGLRGEATE